MKIHKKDWTEIVVFVLRLTQFFNTYVGYNYCTIIIIVTTHALFEFPYL
jgi:hypothetical protein